jgi:hypothetical protein
MSSEKMIKKMVVQNRNAPVGKDRKPIYYSGTSTERTEALAVFTIQRLWFT